MTQQRVNIVLSVFDYVRSTRPRDKFYIKFGFITELGLPQADSAIYHVRSEGSVWKYW